MCFEFIECVAFDRSSCPPYPNYPMPQKAGPLWGQTYVLLLIAQKILVAFRKVSIVFSVQKEIDTLRKAPKIFCATKISS